MRTIDVHLLALLHLLKKTFLYFIFCLPLVAKASPNIVLIYVDDLGYSEVGAYGQKLIKTPHIDALANDGIRFTDAYASSVCSPSRHMLLTGRDPGHAYSRGNARITLPEDSQTLSEALKMAGYETAVIGKWGLGLPGTPGDPLNHGFDYAYGYMNHGDAHDYYQGRIYRNGVEEPRNGEYSHTLFEKDALRWIDTQSPNKPFFLQLAFTIPHGKYQVPNLSPYENQAWSTPEKTYAAMITRLDDSVGRVIAKLEDNNLSQDTLVLFMSDNGASHETNNWRFQSNGDLRGVKRDLYEGGIRVPAIVKWEGNITPAQTNTTPWAVWDIMPTLCEITGALCNRPMDGKSITPLFFQGMVEREHLYFEFHQFHYGKRFKQAIRQGPWKAVRIYGKGGGWGTMELYNLDWDIGETQNFASAYPLLSQQMENLMISERSMSVDHPSPLDVHYNDWHYLTHRSTGKQLRRNGDNSGVEFVTTTGSWAQWQFQHAGGGYYYLLNRGNNQRLGSNNGETLTFFNSDDDNENNLWEIGYIGGQWTFLTHKASGKKIHSRPDESLLNLISPEWAGNNVQWKIKAVENSE